MRRGVILAMCGALALSVAGSACSKDSGTAKAPAPTPAPGAAPSTAPAPAKPPAAKLAVAGTVAPDFEMVAHDGSTVKMSALKGKPVVLYFYPADETPG